MEVMQDSADAVSLSLAVHNPGDAVLHALEFLQMWCWYMHDEGVTVIQPRWYADMDEFLTGFSRQHVPHCCDVV